MEFFITLLGLMCIFEALPYVIAPEAMQRWLRQLIALPPEYLRIAGIVAMIVGLVICWLSRGGGMGPD